MHRAASGSRRCTLGRGGAPRGCAARRGAVLAAPHLATALLLAAIPPSTTLPLLAALACLAAEPRVAAASPPAAALRPAAAARGVVVQRVRLADWREAHDGHGGRRVALGDGDRAAARAGTGASASATCYTAAGRTRAALVTATADTFCGTLANGGVCVRGQIAHGASKAKDAPRPPQRRKAAQRCSGVARNGWSADGGPNRLRPRGWLLHHRGPWRRRLLRRRLRQQPREHALQHLSRLRANLQPLL
mmetsp:Transcript_18728/g.58652  ORF Transcript_18728/g.58652 Transcript_18728/m.58652 type:complete len:248 (+) Transcript_18728:1615-2358(+)